MAKHRIRPQKKFRVWYRATLNSPEATVVIQARNESRAKHVAKTIAGWTGEIMPAQGRYK